MFSNIIKPKLSPTYFCEKCDYGTCKKSNIDNHYRSAKHIKSMIVNDFKPELSLKFVCKKCNKKYKDNSGLWRHSKKCETIESLVTEECKSTDKDLVMMLIKENSELKTMMMKVLENGTTQNSNNTTNSHNKAFNLNVFLNEQCKDAMNMSEFVESIQLQYSDLENVGRLGFVNGISEIIIKNLKALDIHRRPVHCADLKREIMYVKDNNQWNKEEEDNNKLRRAIKCIAQKNSKNLVLFKQKYPDCLQGDSRSSDRYNKLMVEAFGGGKVDDDINEDKIIRRISKEVTIDKSG